MRTSLSCHVTLRHFGVWRSAVAAVAALALAVLVAWSVSAQPMWPDAALAGAAIAGLAVLAVATSLARVDPATLTLQDGLWTYAPERRGRPAEAGHVDVALDLGTFMLLSISRPSAAGHAAGRRWLPAQRQGHEPDWHALRCAVHAPRAAANAAGQIPARPE
jgi:hypothetical protein